MSRKEGDNPVPPPPPPPPATGEPPPEAVPEHIPADVTPVAPVPIQSRV